MKEQGFEGLQQRKFTVLSYAGSPTTWQRYGETMKNIHRKATGKQYTPELQKAQLSNMEKYVSDPDTRVFFLTDTMSNKVVGFTYAYPTDIEPEYYSFAEKERLDRGISTDQYLTLQQKTAEVGWTEILQEYRHQGGWSLLMDDLDKYLVEHPSYQTQVRIVTQRANYAQAVGQRYRNNVLYRSAFTEEYGPQEYFRIKIPKTEPSVQQL